MGVDRWPPREVVTHQSKFDDLVKHLEELRGTKAVSDEDMISLTRFLVVRASGFLEQTSYAVVRAFIQAKSGGHVRSFAHSWIERTRNPSSTNLTTLLGRLDANLSDQFECFLDEYAGRATKRRDYLDLLVNRRNQIAHGYNEGSTLGMALTLAGVALEVADWFILELNPEPRKDWTRART